MKFAIPLLLLMAAQDSAPKPWLGVSVALDEHVPPVNGVAFKRALKIDAPIAFSPADKAGLRRDDWIVAFEGIDFEVDSGQLAAKFREGVAKMQVGSTVALSVVRDWVDKTSTLDGKPLPESAEPELLRDQPPGPKFELVARRRIELLKLQMKLEARPALIAGRRKIPPDAEIFEKPFPVSPEEKLARSLIAEYGIEADMKDLMDRFARLQQEGDPWRLSRMAYVHRNPFSLPAAAQRMIREVTEPRSAADLLRRAAEWIDRPLPKLERPHLAPAGRTTEQRLDEIVSILKAAKTHYDKAFAALSNEDMTFLSTQLNALGEAFTRNIYLEQDDRRDRIEPNLRVIQLAPKVDLTELFAAAEILLVLVDEAQTMRNDLSPATRDTEFGKIVIAGTGRDWHKDDAAVLIDLGGDDFYTNNAGASRGRSMPFSIVIDYEGDDAYESSTDWVQGCGLLGIGILADLGGNDSYLGQRWAQGSAAFGVGILYDSTGDDRYRGWDFVQGAALWGIALAWDGAGQDSYSATRFSQACAMPGGFALLRNDQGDDSYFCKGKYPTSYGDAGLFDSWCQGCAIGFRRMASGGIALLADLSGNDRYEAGHFSQGGGYYFGWGLFFEGAGNDTCIGSRYSQGFAAHEAAGYFEDAGGNDTYRTRHNQSQGASWDESVVAFIERGGDDTYVGGTDFSQGASANNGFCLFVDYGGRDTYTLPTGPARSGGNAYHGGTSFSLFIDAGGGKDVYQAPEGRNDVILKNGTHGFLVDLPGSVEQADVKKLKEK